MSVNVDFSFALSADEQGSGDLGTPRKLHALSFLKSFASGTGTDQFDLVWSDERTVTGVSETLDLVGTLTDAFGTVISGAKLCGIIVWNKARTAGYELILGAAASPVFTGLFGASTERIKVRPGGLFVWLSPVDGATLVAATADGLKVDPGANTITYQIALLMRSS